MVNVKVVVLAGRNVAINNFEDVEELNEFTYNLQDFKHVGTWHSKDARESVEVYVSPDYQTGEKEVA